MNTQNTETTKLMSSFGDAVSNETVKVNISEIKEEKQVETSDQVLENIISAGRKAKATEFVEDKSVRKSNEDINKQLIQSFQKQLEDIPKPAVNLEEDTSKLKTKEVVKEDIEKEVKIQKDIDAALSEGLEYIKPTVNKPVDNYTNIGTAKASTESTRVEEEQPIKEDKSINSYTTDQSRVVTQRQPNVLDHVVSSTQNAMLKKRFSRGGIQVCNECTYAIDQNEIMLMEYLSENPVVKLRDVINGVPVRYINPNFFAPERKNAVSTFKRKVLFGIRKANEQLITSLSLPKRLVKIPEGLLTSNVHLNTLTIPASVSSIDVAAFTKCKINYIFFSGPCPEGLENVWFDYRTKLICRKEYASSFKHIGRVSVAEIGTK